MKWVNEIAVSASPSELDSASRLDRHYAPDISWQTHRAQFNAPDNSSGKSRSAGLSGRDVAHGPVIQTLPVQSVICTSKNL